MHDFRKQKKAAKIGEHLGRQHSDINGKFDQSNPDYKSTNTNKNLSTLGKDESDDYEELTPEQRKLKNRIRFWDGAYNRWNEGKGPKPGPHPVKNNIWNTTPELFDLEDGTPK